MVLKETVANIGELSRLYKSHNQSVDQGEKIKKRVSPVNCIWLIGSFCSRSNVSYMYVVSFCTFYQNNQHFDQ